MEGRSYLPNQFVSGIMSRKSKKGNYRTAEIFPHKNPKVAENSIFSAKFASKICRAEIRLGKRFGANSFFSSFFVCEIGYISRAESSKTLIPWLKSTSEKITFDGVL